MGARPPRERPDKGKAKAKPSGRGQKKELERKLLEDLQHQVDTFVRTLCLQLNQI